MFALILCDDQASHNDTLKYMLTQVIKRYKLDAEVVYSTTTSVELLAYAKQQLHEVSIYFLDICLESDRVDRPEGIKLCRSIQETDPNAYVVYVSAYHQYWMEGFHTHAMDFLVKPFNDAQLTACLLSVIAEIKRRRNALGLQVIAGSRMVVLEQRDILCFRKNREYVCAYMLNGNTFTWREGFASLLKRIEPDLFCQVHRSCCINLNHFREMDWAEGKLTLSDGTQVAVSRRNESLLRQRLAAKGGAR